MTAPAGGGRRTSRGGRGAIQVDGAAALRRELKRAGASVEDLKGPNKEIADMVTEASRPRAPRRSGALAGSERASGTQKEATVKVGRAKVPYAGPVHWGWKRPSKSQPMPPGGHPGRGFRQNIPKNPWVWETARGLEPRIVQTHLDNLEHLIDRIAKGTHP